MMEWLFGKRAKGDQSRQTDRSERNAVIRRIVSAAAETTQKRADRSANGEVIGPFAVELDPTASGNIPRDRIAERAYQIWIRNGRPTGTAEQDWQQAVRELSLELAPASP